MLCTMKTRKENLLPITVVGLVSMLFGWIGNWLSPEAEPATSMLLGMFAGLGTVLLIASSIALSRRRRMTEAQLKQEAIEASDERNQIITAKAMRVAALVTFAALIVAAFVLVGLGYPLASYIIIGIMYVELLAYLAANRYYRSRE